jgi:large subunit ribosomal protein L13
MKSYLAKTGEIEPKWYVIDASGQVLGRLAVRIANILRGRHRPTYTPHTDTGDFVIVINADKVVVSGKKETQKQYMFYSGYVGNEYYRSVKDFRATKPEFLIEHAVKGMLPRNKLAHAQLSKLKVYGGSEHPHAAQAPEALVIS